MRLLPPGAARLLRRSALLNYGVGSIADQWEAFRQLVRNEWPLFLLLLFGLGVLALIVRPLPPRDVYLAVAQPGSEFENLGRRMQPYFAEEGVMLHLVNTQGADASAADVVASNAKVQAAFVIGGVIPPGRQPDLYSLGSVEYVPLWLFYRGPPVRDGRLVAHFANRKVAVGLEGSTTLTIIDDILAATGVKLDDRPNLLKIPFHDATEQLIAGEIDAVCMMDGFESANVQKLLRDPAINIFNFTFADAYVKKLRYLDVVTVPKGALDLHDVRPDEDVRMLASTITIIVRKDLHPAIQQLFLIAGNRISSEVDQFFARPEFFPTYVDHAVPLSPVAKRFIKEGPPPLVDRVPLWLVNFADRVWLLLVGALAVIYPVINLFPSYRRIQSSMYDADVYQTIYGCERAAEAAQSKADLQPIVDTLDAIIARTKRPNLDSDQIPDAFRLRTVANSVRTEIVRRLESLP